MSTTLDRTPAVDGPRPSLLRAEVHRLRSRRFVHVLLALAVVGYVAAVVLMLTQFAKPTAAGQAEAQRRQTAAITEQNRYREDCLRQTPPPGAPPLAEQCGPPVTAENIPVSQFLAKRPFSLADEGRHGLTGVAVVTSLLAFLVGATYVGAEWSSRSMVALLFWVPQRLRVMGTKLGVAAAATVLLGLAGQLAWLATAPVLASLRGADSALPPDFWSELMLASGRGVLLTMLLGLLGFGLANLLRNTAASLGVGFAYFVIVENVLRAARSGSQPWLLTSNAAALVEKGGISVFIEQRTLDQGSNSYSYVSKEVVLGNLHGGLVLGAVVAAVVAAGVVLFARRDLD
jgi:ABC-2 family transporter protein